MTEPVVVPKLVISEDETYLDVNGYRYSVKCRGVGRGKFLSPHLELCWNDYEPSLLMEDFGGWFKARINSPRANKGDRVLAKFLPQRTDDLSNPALQLHGEFLVLEAVHPVPEGEYEGDLAFYLISLNKPYRINVLDENRQGGQWIPERDLCIAKNLGPWPLAYTDSTCPTCGLRLVPRPDGHSVCELCEFSKELSKELSK